VLGKEEGAGADGGDAQTESDGGKAGEADVGSVGKRVWRSGVDG
jgi:hypothetical protein